MLSVVLVTLLALLAPTDRAVRSGAAFDPCPIGALGLARGSSTGATGHTWQYLVLTNHGRGRCSLSGYPRVELVTEKGRALPFRFRRERRGVPAAGPPSVSLRPGGRTFFALAKYRCDLGVRARATRAFVKLGGRGDSARLSIALGPAVDFCGPGDPGSTIRVSPFEPTAQAAFETYFAGGFPG